MKGSSKSVFLAIGLLACSQALADSVVSIFPLTEHPKMDGNLDEWLSQSPQVIKLTPNTHFDSAGSRVDEVLLRAGHFEGHVYFALEWADASEDRLHKPYVWSQEQEKYVRGAQREDRFVFQFGMSGDYQANWLESNGFSADTWHWKASRTDPLGLADDKNMVLGRSHLIRSVKIPTPDGDAVYSQRKWDHGDRLYVTKRYRTYTGDLKPKYILQEGLIDGSTADIKAASQWVNGLWNLELKRKLSTGNSDDVVFSVGESVVGGVAVFNSSESSNHFISDTLVFRIVK